MAIQYRKSGQLEEARSLLLDLITEGESQNPSIWYQCAWVHDNLGKERRPFLFINKHWNLVCQEKIDKVHFWDWGAHIEH